MSARPALAPRHPVLRGARRLAVRVAPVLGLPRAELPVFAALLGVRMMLDERRGQRGDGEESSSPFGKGFWFTALLNLVIGSFLAFALAELSTRPVLALGVLHLGVLFFTTAVLVADYSAVLVDDTDATLMAPLPVTDTSVFAARLAHVVIYVGILAGSLTLPGLVAGCLVYPPWIFAPVYALTVVAVVALAVAVAFGALLLALRAFDPERFRDALLWVQVGVTIGLLAGFQLGPRVLQLSGAMQEILAADWLPWVVPSCHQGGLLALALGEVTARNAGLAALALALPALGIGALVLVTRGSFVTSLASLSVPASSARPPRRRSPIRDLLLRDAPARAGYDFFLALSRRDRQFRLRTYPLLAFALVVGVSFGLGSNRLRDPTMLCGAIYALGLFLPAIVVQARYTEFWEARWILEAAPLQQPGRFVAGANVALVASLLLPMYLVLLALVALVGGAGIAEDAVLATELMVLVSASCLLWLGRKMPFTARPVGARTQVSLATGLAMSAVVAVTIAAHSLLRKSPTAFHVAVAALAPASFVVVGAVARSEPSVESWHGPGRQARQNP